MNPHGTDWEKAFSLTREIAIIGSLISVIWDRQTCIFIDKKEANMDEGDEHKETKDQGL